MGRRGLLPDDGGDLGRDRRRHDILSIEQLHYQPSCGDCNRTKASKPSQSHPTE
eukprot:m.41991 g.41991  ORF g.41991 m.41991 type:complete len:54 (+) comp10635_c0_seq1:3445-3606(+)